MGNLYLVLDQRRSHPSDTPCPFAMDPLNNLEQCVYAPENLNTGRDVVVRVGRPVAVRQSSVVQGHVLRLAVRVRAALPCGHLCDGARSGVDSHSHSHHLRRALLHPLRHPH